MKKRIDHILVECGFVPSRAKAHELIERESVRLDNKIIKNKSLNLDASDLEALSQRIKITENDLLKYVSRGGLKLESALKHLKLSVRDWNCLDVGASTGGFSDCLLKSGASSVLAVDVGHKQLDPRLLKVPNFISIEGLHLKDMNTDRNFIKAAKQEFDLVVSDLSFISILKALEHLIPRLKSGGHLLVLIKPQFEVGSVNLNKHGIVKNEAAVQKALEDIKVFAIDLGLQNIEIFASGLVGRDGNQEYFMYAKKQ